MAREKGVGIHQQYSKNVKPSKEHSHKNGWLSGLKRSLERGTISKLDYQEAVEAYRRNSRRKTGMFSYSVRTVHSSDDISY